MQPAQLHLDKDTFLDHVTDVLGKIRIDFAEKLDFIRSTRDSKNNFLAAGVLLLLFMRTGDPFTPRRREWVFQLIKRSSKVTQPGDLSCPGGILNTLIDPILRFFIILNVFPIMKNKAFTYAIARDEKTYHAMTLLLTNAVREAWEEIGISPFNITLLGPLPSYTLHFFRRTIFPLVCHVKDEWSFHPSDEVEKIIEIPVSSFFDESNYGICIIESPHQKNQLKKETFEYPCFIYREDRSEEILWGATFSIIMNFLNLVFAFTLPENLTDRIVRKTLSPTYLAGPTR